jgi:hypothetical protein
MPKGHTVAHVRLDSAGYQADIFNYCEESGKTFAIGGRPEIWGLSLTRQAF